MIAPGASGHPLFGAALSAGPQILGVKFVKSGFAELKFERGGVRAQFAEAEPREEVADEWRCESMNDLRLFTAKSKKKEAFFA